jgi:hypothetical protein
VLDTLQSHWGFTVMPFTATVPAAGLFGSAAHKEAAARLRWLISARGLGVLTGEVGSGKTVNGSWRRGVPAKLGPLEGWGWSRAGVAGDRCAARAPAGAVTGSRVAGARRDVQPGLCGLR